MDPGICKKLQKSPDAFACVNWYDRALQINTRGASWILEFVRRCKKVQMLLHVSTAYVNGQRQGKVLKKPFQMGHSIAREGEKLNFECSDLNIEAEFELVQNTVSGLLMSRMPMSPNEDKEICQTMKELGLQRAQKFGWQDTYVFSKAMGEMLIDHNRGDMPVVAIRPSVIKSTYTDPFPRWMEGNRMMDPIVLYYGKEQLSGFLADKNGVLDVFQEIVPLNAANVLRKKDTTPAMKLVSLINETLNSRQPQYTSGFDSFSSSQSSNLESLQSEVESPSMASYKMNWTNYNCNLKRILVI